jgi:hypothetical protein
LGFLLPDPVCHQYEKNTTTQKPKVHKTTNKISTPNIQKRHLHLAHKAMENLTTQVAGTTTSTGKHIVHDEHCVWIDLKLDARLKPLSIEEFTKSAPKVSSSEQLASSLVNGETYGIGSGSKNDHIYFPGDLGLFGCIFEAWKNHWNIRTRPEDWWGPIACKIAKAIDTAAKRYGEEAEKVRELFVSHNGKEELEVNLPSYTIYDDDYDVLFSEISSKIEEKIKVPMYAQVMQNDFESSGLVHKIASQINLMASMQQFFTYGVRRSGCGLRGLEMIGSIDDWDCLVAKLQEVREILLPIQDATRLELPSRWWSHVLDVFENLANTRRSPDDPAVAKFWINILMETTDKEYVGGGASRVGEPVEVEAYDGWLISFLTNDAKLWAKDLTVGGRKNVQKQLSGWNQVPLKVSLTWCRPAIQDNTTLVAGIVGYKVHKGPQEDALFDEAKDGEPQEDKVALSVEPNHMWAMLLSPQSKLRWVE